MSSAQLSLPSSRPVAYLDFITSAHSSLCLLILLGKAAVVRQGRIAMVLYKQINILFVPFTLTMTLFSEPSFQLGLNLGSCACLGLHSVVLTRILLSQFRKTSPTLMSADPGLPSARILLTGFSNNPPALGVSF